MSAAACAAPPGLRRPMRWHTPCLLLLRGATPMSCAWNSVCERWRVLPVHIAGPSPAAVAALNGRGLDIEDWQSACFVPAGKAQTWRAGAPFAPVWAHPCPVPGTSWVTRAVCMRAPCPLSTELGLCSPVDLHNLSGSHCSAGPCVQGLVLRALEGCMYGWGTVDETHGVVACAY